MKASVVDLRHKMREVLEALDRGESVTMLYHGKERARLVPIEGTAKCRPRIEDDPAFGLWADHEDKKDVDAYVRRIRQERYRDL